MSSIQPASVPEPLLRLDPNLGPVPPSGPIVHLAAVQAWDDLEGGGVFVSTGEGGLRWRDDPRRVRASSTSQLSRPGVLLSGRSSWTLSAQLAGPLGVRRSPIYTEAAGDDDYLEIRTDQLGHVELVVARPGQPIEVARSAGSVAPRLAAQWVGGPMLSYHQDAAYDATREDSSVVRRLYTLHLGDGHPFVPGDEVHLGGFGAIDGPQFVNDATPDRIEILVEDPADDPALAGARHLPGSTATDQAGHLGIVLDDERVGESFTLVGWVKKVGTSADAVEGGAGIATSSPIGDARSDVARLELVHDGSGSPGRYVARIAALGIEADLGEATLDTWRHFAVRLDGDGLLHAFVDGVDSGPAGLHSTGDTAILPDDGDLIVAVKVRFDAVASDQDIITLGGVRLYLDATAGAFAMDPTGGAVGGSTDGLAGSGVVNPSFESPDISDSALLGVAAFNDLSNGWVASGDADGDVQFFSNNGVPGGTILLTPEQGSSAPHPNQRVLIRNGGAIEQTITVDQDGYYEIKIDHTFRRWGTPGQPPHTVAVEVDDVQAGTIVSDSSLDLTWAEATIGLRLTPGEHTLRLRSTHGTGSTATPATILDRVIVHRAAPTIVRAPAGGGVLAENWYQVVARVDRGSGQIALAVNDAAEVVEDYEPAVGPGTISYLGFADQAAGVLSGDLDAIAVFKGAAGALAAQVATIRSTHAAATSYASLGASFKADSGLVSWSDAPTAPDVVYADAHGSHDFVPDFSGLSWGGFGLGYNVAHSGRLDCHVDDWGLWLGRALSAADIEAIHNAGSGATWGELDPAIRLGAFGWWAFDERGGDAADASDNGHHLINGSGAFPGAPGLGATSFVEPANLLANGSFEQPTEPATASNGFQSGPAIPGWSASGSYYVAGGGGNNTILSSYQLCPVPDGTYCAAIQGTGSLSQGVSIATAGTYRIRLWHARRYESAIGDHDFEILVDGRRAGAAIHSTGINWGPVERYIHLEPGTRTLTIAGINSGGGDNTSLIDAVELGLVSYDGRGIPWGLAPSSPTVRATGRRRVTANVRSEENQYEWHRHALHVVRDGGEVRFYRNGAPLGPAAINPTATGPASGTSTLLSPSDRLQGVPCSIYRVEADGVALNDASALWANRRAAILATRARGPGPLGVHFDATYFEGGVGRQEIQDCWISWEFVDKATGQLHDPDILPSGQAYARPSSPLCSQVFREPGAYECRVTIARPPFDIRGVPQAPEVLWSGAFETVVVEPWPAGTRDIHVDSAVGDDSNAGTEAAPVRTWGEAMARVTQPYTRVFLRAGREWQESSYTIQDKTGPLLVTRYGDGDAPLLRQESASLNINASHDLRIDGIAIRPEPREWLELPPDGGKPAGIAVPTAIRSGDATSVAVTITNVLQLPALPTPQGTINWGQFFDLYFAPRCWIFDRCRGQASIYIGFGTGMSYFSITRLEWHGEYQGTTTSEVLYVHLFRLVKASRCEIRGLMNRSPYRGRIPGYLGPQYSFPDPDGTGPLLGWSGPSFRLVPPPNVTTNRSLSLWWTLADSDLPFRSGFNSYPHTTMDPDERENYGPQHVVVERCDAINVNVTGGDSATVRDITFAREPHTYLGDDAISFQGENHVRQRWPKGHRQYHNRKPAGWKLIDQIPILPRNEAAELTVSGEWSDMPASGELAPAAIASLATAPGAALLVADGPPTGGVEMWARHRWMCRPAGSTGPFQELAGQVGSAAAFRPAVAGDYEFRLDAVDQVSGAETIGVSTATATIPPSASGGVGYLMDAPAPSSGLVGQPSGPFVVRWPGATPPALPIAVVPSSDGQGSFDPAQVWLSVDSLSAEFRFTPEAAGSWSVVTTNDAGLIDPAAVTFTATEPVLPPVDPDPVDPDPVIPPIEPPSMRPEPVPPGGGGPRSPLGRPPGGRPGGGRPDDPPAASPPGGRPGGPLSAPPAAPGSQFSLPWARRSR